MALTLTPPRTDAAAHVSTRRESPHNVGLIVREVLLVATVFVLYRQVRHVTSGSLDRAVVNAGNVVGLEQWLGAFSEASLQRFVLRSELAIQFLDHYYVFVHFTASFGFMAWAFLRHRDAWTRIRIWFLSVTLAGLAIHVAFPLAPPRLIDGHGFVDTLKVYGPNIYTSDVTTSSANQLAAMPSLHFAWAAIVAAGVISIRRTRGSWLMLLHPLITLLAIVATANHYWLDAFVGAMLVVTAVSIFPVWVRTAPLLVQVGCCDAIDRAGQRDRTAQSTCTTSSPVRTVPGLRFAPGAQLADQRRPGPAVSGVRCTARHRLPVNR